MAKWSWAALGVVLAAAFLGFARRGSEGRERRILAVGLVLAAAVYVCSAALIGAAADVLLALVGLGFFLGAAVLGIRWGASWLAWGWAVHVLWDGFLHFTTPGIAPAWYALLCLGFDFTVAGAVLAHRPTSLKP